MHSIYSVNYLNIMLIILGAKYIFKSVYWSHKAHELHVDIFSSLSWFYDIELWIKSVRFKLSNVLISMMIIIIVGHYHATTITKPLAEGSLCILRPALRPALRTTVLESSHYSSHFIYYNI